MSQKGGGWGWGDDPYFAVTLTAAHHCFLAHALRVARLPCKTAAARSLLHHGHVRERLRGTRRGHHRVHNTASGQQSSPAVNRRHS